MEEVYHCVRCYNAGAQRDEGSYGAGNGIAAALEKSVEGDIHCKQRIAQSHESQIFNRLVECSNLNTEERCQRTGKDIHKGANHSDHCSVRNYTKDKPFLDAVKSAGAGVLAGECCHRLHNGKDGNGAVMVIARANGEGAMSSTK